MNILKSKWSKWIDLSVGSLSDRVYVLQGSRNTNGKVRFRVEVSNSCYYAKPQMELSHLEKLVSL